MKKIFGILAVVAATVFCSCSDVTPVKVTSMNDSDSVSVDSVTVDTVGNKVIIDSVKPDSNAVDTTAVK